MPSIFFFRLVFSVATEGESPVLEENNSGQQVENVPISFQDWEKAEITPKM